MTHGLGKREAESNMHTMARMTASFMGKQAHLLVLWPRSSTDLPTIPGRAQQG